MVTKDLTPEHAKRLLMDGEVVTSLPGEALLLRWPTAEQVADSPCAQEAVEWARNFADNIEEYRN